MKEVKILSISCFLFLLATNISFAKPSPMPEWVENYRSIYPDSEYLCQRGSGKSAEEAKTDATGALARYFQMNVSANLSTTMTSFSSGTEIQEETAIINDVQVMSQVDFFGLEYTEPYYLKNEKKWYCVAFINRENAWIQYKPQIEIAKNSFEGLLKNAEKENDNFSKLKALKTAWQKGKDLIEKLEYGRLISPTREAEYSSSRDKFSEIPVIFEETKSKCKTYISADYYCFKCKNSCCKVYNCYDSSYKRYPVINGVCSNPNKTSKSIIKKMPQPDYYYRL